MRISQCSRFDKQSKLPNICAVKYFIRTNEELFIHENYIIPFSFAGIQIPNQTK